MVAFSFGYNLSVIVKDFPEILPELCMLRVKNTVKIVTEQNDRTDSYQIREVGRDDITSLPRMDIRDIG